MGVIIIERSLWRISIIHLWKTSKPPFLEVKHKISSHRDMIVKSSLAPIVEVRNTMSLRTLLKHSLWYQIPEHGLWCAHREIFSPEYCDCNYIEKSREDRSMESNVCMMGILVSIMSHVWNCVPCQKKSIHTPARRWRRPTFEKRINWYRDAPFSYKMSRSFLFLKPHFLIACGSFEI